MEIKYRQNPFAYENDKSDTVVIFIHGILEGPTQFEAFSEVCVEYGHSVSAILLHGHGQSGKDFAKSSKGKWIESVEKEIDRYKDRYKNIILVGHSMGALLSMLSYEKYRKSIKKMVLIATPIKVSVKANIARSSIKTALGNIKKYDALTNHAYKAFSVDRSSLLTYIKWLPRYFDLFSLIQKSKKNINKIDIETLIIHSQNDELVSKKSLNILNSRLMNESKYIQLDNSGHFYYSDEDLKKLLIEFKEFIVIDDKKATV